MHVEPNATDGEPRFSAGRGDPAASPETLSKGREPLLSLELVNVRKTFTLKQRCGLFKRGCCKCCYAGYRVGKQLSKERKAKKGEISVDMDGTPSEIYEDGDCCGRPNYLYKCLDATDLKCQRHPPLYKTCGFCVHKDTTQKIILNNVNLSLEPGDCVAVIGGSGAGKSTLLKIIGRQDVEHRGAVLLNGDHMDRSVYRKEVAYISQEENFIGNLTVREHLQYQATLRLPLPEDERTKRVDEMLSFFLLDSIAESRIGNVRGGQGRGISGGEKKRLNVATELLSGPRLVLADEPTSGLDSHMASEVVARLGRLAKEGTTVLATIHQPAEDVFSVFNKVLVLAEGSVVYFGPREGMLAYFGRLGNVCPPFTNPSDFVLDIFAIDWSHPATSLALVENYARFWNLARAAFATEWNTELKKSVRKLTTEQQDICPQEAPQIADFQVPRTSEGVRLRVKNRVRVDTLLKRTFKTTRRAPMATYVKTVQALFFALLAGIIFWRLEPSNFSSVGGGFFMILMNTGMPAMTEVPLSLIPEVSMVRQEKALGVINAASYLGAKMVSDFVFTWYNPLVFMSIAWWMCGFNDDVFRFLQALVVIFFFVLNAQSLGYIIGCLTLSEAAFAILPLVVLPLSLTSGFMINFESLAGFWNFLKEISPFRYAWSGLMQLTYIGRTWTCGNASPLCAAPGSEVSGEAVLRFYSIEDDEVWFCLLILAVEIVVFRVLAMLIFMYKLRRKS